MENPIVTTYAFPINQMLAEVTNTPELRGMWIEAPHGSYRESWGSSWHYVRNEEVIEIIVDQAETITILYFAADGTRTTLKEITVNPEDYQV
jgi:hypothetical protein